MTSVEVPGVVARGSTRLRIYLPIALTAMIVALVGFWPTYFSRLVSGTVDAPWIIHVHATVFGGWLILLIMQVTFVARGRQDLHVRVGRIGIAWGALVVVVGITTALFMFGVRVRAGDLAEAHRRLFAPLTDMVVFAPFLVAAWAFREKPEIHKRLMIVATTILLIAAVHRMTVFGGPPAPLPHLLIVWLLPILIGLGHDVIVRRMVHPVYVIGIAAVLYLKFLRGPLYRSEVWNRFVEWLMTFYT